MDEIQLVYNCMTKEQNISSGLKLCKLTNGWSFLHAFLSSANLASAIPDIVILVAAPIKEIQNNIQLWYLQLKRALCLDSEQNEKRQR